LPEQLIDQSITPNNRFDKTKLELDDVAATSPTRFSSK